MHGNRAFMTARAVPSRLYWSKLNNTLDWTGTTDAGFMDVEPNDNSTIIDLVSSIQELVILKGRRPYRLQGIGPVTGYTVADHLVPTVGSVGAISSQGAQFALNDVYYVSELGLHNLTQTQQFGDLKEAFLSDRVEPYFRLYSDVALALNQLSKAVLAYDSQANNLYLCVDSDNDGVNDTTLCYDLVLKAWTVWTSTPFASMFTVRHPTTGAREVWGGGYDGFVYALTRSTGSTEAVSGIVSHITDLGAPGVLKSLRYGFFYFTTESSSVTARVTTTFDFGVSGGQVYDLTDLAGTGDHWGTTFVWGVSNWGSGGAAVIRRVDFSGLGEVVEITVENLEPGEAFTYLGANSSIATGGGFVGRGARTMATLTTLVDGQLAIVAPVNGNFTALNTEITAAMRTGYASAEQIGNVTTGEDVLHTWTMPAATLVAAGDGLVIRSAFELDSNANIKTVRLVLGATAAIVMNPTTGSPNAKFLTVQLMVNVMTAATGLVEVSGVANLVNQDGTVPAMEGVFLTERTLGSLATNIIVKFTGEAVATNDILQRGTLISSFRAAS